MAAGENVEDDDRTAVAAEFRRLLARRNRWRWGFSLSLIGAYLAWGVGGLYFADAYARPIAGSSIPRGMAAGVLIIVLAIVMSIVYVRVVNRIEAEESAARGGPR